MNTGKPRIAILDYRMGNLRSVQKALELLGADAWIAHRPEQVEEVDGIILPGVGAFGDAMDNLGNLGFITLLEEAVRSHTPLLGICVGLQVLFEESTEMGTHRGLGILPGRVVRFEPPLVVPHVGWNQIHVQQPHFLVDALENGSYAYFTHSYYAVPGETGDIVATTDYGSHFASVVARGNVSGVQFHPEKSWKVGLKLLSNFVGSLRP